MSRRLECHRSLNTMRPELRPLCQTFLSSCPPAARYKFPTLSVWYVLQSGNASAGQTLSPAPPSIQIDVGFFSKFWIITSSLIFWSSLQALPVTILRPQSSRLPTGMSWRTRSLGNAHGRRPPLNEHNRLNAACHRQSPHDINSSPFMSN